MYTRLAILIVVIYTYTHAYEPKVVKPNSTPAIPFPPHKTYLLSEADSTPSEVAVLEIELSAKSFGAPPHIHSKEDEHFYVLEGSVNFLNKEEIVKVGPGGLIVLPRGNIHGFWNHSDKPAKMLLIVTPGKFASFFDKVVSQVRKENPDNPKLVGQIMGKVAAQYGVTIYPDKVPQSALPLLSNREE